MNFKILCFFLLDDNYDIKIKNNNKRKIEMEDEKDTVINIMCLNNNCYTILKKENTKKMYCCHNYCQRCYDVYISKYSKYFCKNDRCWSNFLKIGYCHICIYMKFKKCRTCKHGYCPNCNDNQNKKETLCSICNSYSCGHKFFDYESQINVHCTCTCMKTIEIKDVDNICICGNENGYCTCTIEF